MSVEEGTTIGQIRIVDGTSGAKHLNLISGDGSFNPNVTDTLLEDGTYHGIAVSGPSTITILRGKSGVLYENLHREDGTIGDKLIE